MSETEQTKQNKTKQNETKRNKTKQNETNKQELIERDGGSKLDRGWEINNFFLLGKILFI
jgi:hypothetical protein